MKTTTLQRIAKPAAVAVSVALLAACGSKDEQLDQAATQETTRSDSGIGTDGADTYRPPAQQQPQTPVDPDIALRNKRTLYFEFDSAELDSESLKIVRAHGRYLLANPGIRIRLEGHTDERGTREYNVALGERRAKAVERVMLLQGVARSQLSSISYGEENPVDLGHTESAWAKNRRVEIQYR